MTPSRPGVGLAGGRPWRTVAASVTGTSHADAGHPCADACAVRVLRAKGGGSLLVAVAADGAGSCARAPEGARLACDAILEQAERWAQDTAVPRAGRVPSRGRRGSRTGAGGEGLSAFRRGDVVRWVDVARGQIVSAAAVQGLGGRDFSCTLLVALVDERSAVFFQIGDGAIVYRGAEGGYVPALWPQSGEYANCTWFVTDEDARDRVQSTVVEGVHELALLTDGLQGLALRFATREAHGPFFEPMFARLRDERGKRSLLGELQAFLASPPVNKRTDDDKTLVLATRLPAPTAVGRAEADD